MRLRRVPFAAWVYLCVSLLLATLLIVGGWIGLFLAVVLIVAAVTTVARYSRS